MSASSETRTQDKIRSLRIDPSRKERPRRSRRGWIPGLVIGILLGAVGAMVLRSDRAQPVEVRVVRARVVEGQSGDGLPSASASAATLAAAMAAPPGETVLTASGYVTPRHRISLSPRVMGLVAWVGIEKGDRVAKDQVLVRLKDDEYRAQVRQAKARLESAEARLAELLAGTRPEEIDRARAELRAAEADLKNAEIELQRRKTLVADKEVDPQFLLDNAQAARDRAAARRDSAKQTLDLLLAGPRKEQIQAARAEADAAKAALEYSEILLEDTVIRAPVDGTVLEKLIEVGELVSPQSFGGTRGARTELLSLADLTNLQVEVDVNESDFAKIRMAQPTLVTLDAYPDRKYSGRVVEIAPEANRQKATVQIKVKVLDPDERVLPEMNARVDFLALSGAAPLAAESAPQPPTVEILAPEESATTPGGETHRGVSSSAAESSSEAAAPRRRVYIPKEAIAERAGVTVVFVAVDDRAVRREIKPGLAAFPGSRTGEVEVLSGLNGGEPIIVSSLGAINDGTPVRVVLSE